MRNSLELFRRGGSPLDLMNEMDQMFEQFRGQLSPALQQSQNRERWFEPSFEVQETEGAFLLSVDVPGMKKDDVKIDLIDRTLTISGERRSQKETASGEVQRMQRSYGRFMRSFTLPENVDMEQVEANIEDGVLSIAIPKVEAAQPRQIQIGERKEGFFSKFLGSQKDGAKTDAGQAKRTH